MKYFIRLIVFLSILLVQFAQPSFALVNSSLQSAVGLEVLSYEAGGTLAAATPSAVSTSLTAGGLTVSGSFVGGGVAVLGAAGLGLYGLTTSAVTQLQNKAQQKYCTSFPNDSKCQGQGSWVVHYDDHLDDSFPGTSADNLHFTSTVKSGCNYWTDLVSDIRGIIVEGWGCGRPYPYSGLSVTFIPTPGSTGLPFSDWSPSDKAAAIASLLPSDIASLVTKAGSIPLSAIDAANVPLSGTNIISGVATSLANGVASYLSSSVGGCPPALPNPYCTCNSGSDGVNGANGSQSSPGDGNGDDDGDGTNNNDSCSALQPFETDKSPNTFIQVANVLASILPSTPDNMRLPTLIANMGGQGSLAGNLGLEIYSAAWQYFAIIAFIKFYKLIPGKMS